MALAANLLCGSGTAIRASLNDDNECAAVIGLCAVLMQRPAGCGAIDEQSRPRA
jgi:hypothetical protein